MRDGRAEESSVRVVHGHNSLTQAAGDAEVSAVGNHAGAFVEQDCCRGSSPGLTRLVADKLGVVDVQRSTSDCYASKVEATRVIDDNVGIATGDVIRVGDDKINNGVGAATDALLHITNRCAVQSDVSRSECDAHVPLILSVRRVLEQ